MPRKKVDLFYLSNNSYGGWVTYTAHLFKCLEATGIQTRLFRIGNRTEKRERNFGYGVNYRNVSMEDTHSLGNRKLVVAAAKRYLEETTWFYGTGAGLVVHDPTELKNLPPLGDNIVVIRKAGLQYLPDATFIRHPYIARPSGGKVAKKVNALSVCRIDFDKYTDILLDANRLLPEDKRIEIRGFENRIYTKFKIIPEYPEWVQSRGAYPRTAEAAYEMLQQASFAVDMSQIKGDGGGTQYSFLEAMNAGAVNIIHSNWVREGDDMAPGKNCLAVDSAEELAEVLSRKPGGREHKRIVGNGLQHLENHSPEKVGPQYKAFLDRL